MNIGSFFSSGPSQSHMQSAFSVLEKNITETNLFSKNSLPSQSLSEEPEIGSFTYSEKDFSANTSSLVRQLGSSSPAASALGLTTCWNLPQGIIGWNQAKKSYLRALEINDTIGQTLAASNLALRSGQTVGGASFCFIRMQDIINNGLHGSHDGLNAISSYAIPISTYGFGALYAAFLPLAGISIAEINRYLGKMKLAEQEMGSEFSRRLIGDLTGVLPYTMFSQDFYEGLGQELRRILPSSLQKDALLFSDESLGRSLFDTEMSYSSMKHALWKPGDYRKYLPQVLKNLSVSITNELKAQDLKKNARLISALWERKKLKEQEVHIQLGIKLKEIFSEIDPKLVKKLSYEELGKALFTKEYQKFLPLVLEKMGISGKNIKTVQDLQGNQILVRSLWGQTKAAIHSRVFGSRGMDAISKAEKMHLYELLGSTKESDRKFAEKQAEILFKELKAGAKENRWVCRLYFLTGLIGTIFTGITDKVYSAVGFLCCFILMWLADYANFQQVSRGEGPVGKWDRLYIISHLLLGVFATTIATLFLVGVFGALTYGTGGLFLPISILIIGSVWMGVDIWALGQVEKRRAKYKKDHPTLQTFLQKVQSKASFDEKEEMFHKLPKLMQKQILFTGLEKTGPAKDLYASFDIQPLVTQKRIRKAVQITQDTALDKEILPITEKNFFVHPCRKLFIQNLYNEWTREGQRKILQRIDRVEGRLQSTIESVMKKVQEPFSSSKRLIPA